MWCDAFIKPFNFGLQENRNYFGSHMSKNTYDKKNTLIENDSILKHVCLPTALNIHVIVGVGAPDAWHFMITGLLLSTVIVVGCDVTMDGGAENNRQDFMLRYITDIRQKDSKYTLPVIVSNTSRSSADIKLEHTNTKKWKRTPIEYV